jgi:hypothetical protein
MLHADSPLLPRILIVLGVGFLVVNLRLFLQFFRFRRLRATALLIWPGRRPPLYTLFLSVGALLGLLIIYKLTVLKLHPSQVFGETMMLVYYVYALPLSLRIGRGFYEDGIWTEAGFMPYSRIGGITWREEGQITLVLMYRMRSIARRLIVPERYYGAARRVLRDKIAAHDIHFTGKTLDLGMHDERDDV